MRRWPAALLSAALVAACAVEPGASPPTARTAAAPGSDTVEDGMHLTSTAFDDGGAIPARHSCEGEDVSPPLAWEGAPDGTAAFVIIVHDPDARDFVHWLLTDVPGDVRSLAEGEGDRAGTPGRNDFGRAGWSGPCPPSGQHRYVFTLTALSSPLGLGGTPSESEVRAAMEGRALAEAELTGSFAR